MLFEERERFIGVFGDDRGEVEGTRNVSTRTRSGLCRDDEDVIGHE